MLTFIIWSATRPCHANDENAPFSVDALHMQLNQSKLDSPTVNCPTPRRRAVSALIDPDNRVPNSTESEINVIQEFRWGNYNWLLLSICDTDRYCRLSVSLRDIPLEAIQNCLFSADRN